MIIKKKKEKVEEIVKLPETGKKSLNMLGRS
jgi:hypothetical protein